MENKIHKSDIMFNMTLHTELIESQFKKKKYIEREKGNSF